MNTKNNPKKVSGYIMAIIGFVLILVNAIGYILKTNSTPSVIFILGIIFLVIGMMSIRKSER
ncbi:MAG TPA: hypothetical protein HA367_03345 [Candidatus Methanofastidiosum sp.]|nr:hypothetical protein [Methanofastidiosum sp.]